MKRITLDEAKVIWEEHANAIIQQYGVRLKNISSEPVVMDLATELKKYKFNFNRGERRLSQGDSKSRL